MKFYFRLFLAFQLTAIFTNISAQSPQVILDKKVNITAQNLSVKEVLEQISTNYGISFSYSNDLVMLPQKVNITATNQTLKTVLDQIFSGSNIKYKVVGNQVIFQADKDITKGTMFSGYVEDSKSGERIIGCVVYDSSSRATAITNAFGYFSLPVKKGEHTISIRYLGYVNKSFLINVSNDISQIIKLDEATVVLKEVTVTNSRFEENLSKPQMGQMSMNNMDVRKIPVLLGEADIMRAVQIMPGIQAANERSTGISVRGGSIDQNLFLIDDAPVFQISHLMGFYSVFNNDAVKDIKVYKSDIPANYGDRLSSLIDIRLKDGNMNNYSVNGGLGLITSNLSVEGPIIKERASFIVSGKYAYIGALYKLMNPNINMSFYDINVKGNAVINAKNRIYISSYNGGDNSLRSSKYRNNTLTLRWNHVYNPKLFSNISFIYSNFGFSSDQNDTTSYSYTWKSGIKEFSLKADYNYYLNAHNTIDFGLSVTYNNFMPGKIEGSRKSLSNLAKTTSYSNRVVNNQDVLNYAFYVSDRLNITDKLSARYGLRASLYQVLGGHWVYKLTNYQVTDSFYASHNNVFAHYFSLEPRISLNYRVLQNSAIKASYTYTTQQTQLLVRTNGGGPLDVWFPSDNNIKPQTSSQYSCGYVHYFFNNLLETSIEGYYKNMNNIIDYKDGATFLSKYSTSYVDKTTYNFEEQLRVGKGYAYGMELSVKYEHPRLNGFITYTYARSKRKIPEINFGETYLSPFDRPHTFDGFINFNISKRTSLSVNYRRQSGQVTTIPVYMAIMFGKTMKGYSNRNEYRLPYYERLDLSFTVKSKDKPGKRYHGEWNISIINVTNHANFQYVDFIPSKENPEIIEAKGVNMFGFIPSLSYHFNF